MRVLIDGRSYRSKSMALAEMEEAMMCCDGSEQERMTFAYLALKDGCTVIDTYREIAV